MENSEISWTHHTFNPWWGCVKVSPGCSNCYAESLSTRFGHNIWGPAKTTDRRLFDSHHWVKPLVWDGKAKKAGERHRVFCASMADVFEDHPQVIEERRRLVILMENTPNLVWLLLTKRPQNIMPMLDAATTIGAANWLAGMGDRVWIGTSVESQTAADTRIPYLIQVPAKVRFLSCEPLLGAVDLRIWLRDENDRWNSDLLHWIIVGGESGPHARPMHPDHARLLRDQCQAAGVPFHFKQWGEWYPDNKGIYEGVRSALFGNAVVHRVGKKAAGHLLNGVEYLEFPQVTA